MLSYLAAENPCPGWEGESLSDQQHQCARVPRSSVTCDGHVLQLSQQLDPVERAGQVFLLPLHGDGQEAGRLPLQRLVHRPRLRRGGPVRVRG